MAKKRAVTAARAAVERALAGEPEPSLEALLALSEQGDGCAAASAAELLAFMGRWSELVPHARRLLANPSAVSTSNVFSDACRLVRRASRELGDPSIIEESAKLVPASMSAQTNAVLLSEYVEPSSIRAPDVAKYNDAIAAATKDRRFKNAPEKLALHAFALAVVFGVDEAIIERFDETHPHFHFDHAVSVARAWVKQGQPERAWPILRAFVPRWWPVDPAQVAPVILLVDPWISRVVTPERAREVLAIDRARR